MSRDHLSDLRTLLREDVLGGEPPFNNAARQWRQAGQDRVRRRRRRLTTTSAVIAIVAVAAVVVGTQGASPARQTSRGSDMPAAARKTLAEFDPATFPSVLDTEVRAQLGDVIPPTVQGRVQATLGGYSWLRPQDYQFSDAWTARYQLSATDRVTVILQRDPSANDGSAQRYCQENLATGEVERCTVASPSDGIVSISTVTKQRYTARGFTSVRAKDGPNTWWFVRQVFNRRDYGFGVIAREYVKANSLTQADQLWSATEAQLEAVAASPVLVYRLPVPGPSVNCQVGYTVPAREDDFTSPECSTR